MSRRAHGQIRRGQVITTYGPGALIDQLEAFTPSPLEKWIDREAGGQKALVRGAGEGG